MLLSTIASLIVVATFSTSSICGWVLRSPMTRSFHAHGSLVSSSILLDATMQENKGATTDDDVSRSHHSLTQDLISKLRFRDLQRELERRQLDAMGTTAQLRERLRVAALGQAECVVEEGDDSDACEPALDKLVVFIDESDPEFEYKDLCREILAKAEQGHWKAATRKLKKLTRRYASSKAIPLEIFEKTLNACMLNRLQGARASEPARKILEQMAEQGYPISEPTGNYCIKNCLGDMGPDSTHQGFGGIDSALAMKMALDMAGTHVQVDTNEKLAIALARAGSAEESLSILKTLLVEKPNLVVFSEIAVAFTKPENLAQCADQVPTLMAYAKAAGYDLDAIASTPEGISILASGVIAANQLNNVALGLRLLTAARQVDGGDKHVSRSSAATNRACTRVHQQAINQAVVDDQWKLAVKLLSLMVERELRASPLVWRNVITCCAKARKSKKATALLLDWVRLSEEKKADKPQLAVFNTVVNTCEICDEQELTLTVLDAMKNTHDTEGNIITFNIALKRLAKQGNYVACEGLIVAMLQNGVEPTVVSYTTAIAACASKEYRQASLAYEWLKRMRSRRVNPNVLTYNTALAACLDGKLEGSVLSGQIAREMLFDARKQACDEEQSKYDQYTNVLPDATSKMLVRQALQQYELNVAEAGMDRDNSICQALQEIADYEATCVVPSPSDTDENKIDQTLRTELELEFTTAANTHRVAEV